MQAQKKALLILLHLFEHRLGAPGKVAWALTTATTGACKVTRLMRLSLRHQSLHPLQKRRSRLWAVVDGQKDLFCDLSIHVRFEFMPDREFKVLQRHVAILVGQLATFGEDVEIFVRHVHLCASQNMCVSSYMRRELECQTTANSPQPHRGTCTKEQAMNANA